MPNYGSTDYKEELNKIANISKKIIRESVLGIFGQKTLDKVDEALQSITFGIDTDQKSEKKFMAYCKHNKIYWKKDELEECSSQIIAIAINIHEMSHALSNLISNGKMNIILDEGMANIFAETCINYYLQAGYDIPYISREEQKKFTEKGIRARYTYKRECEFFRGVLYPLRKQGKDLDAIKEYLFGEKNKFVDICEKVLGPDVSTVFQDMKHIKATPRERDFDMYLSDISEKMAEIIGKSKVKMDYSDTVESRSIKKGKLYSTYSPIIENAYYYRIIKQLYKRKS